MVSFQSDYIDMYKISWIVFYLCDWYRPEKLFLKSQQRLNWHYNSVLLLTFFCCFRGLGTPLSGMHS